MEHQSPNPSWVLSSCVLLVLLTTMDSCSSSAARSPGNETDRTALINIKLRMSDSSGFLNSWNDSQHHCQWPGIICNTRHRRVTNLTLQGKTLSGTISPYLGNLSFMKGIRLGENLLQGEIPQQIGQLSRLSVLNLSNNLLSGEIPVNLTRCSMLIYINLRQNRLTGGIPTVLGSLANLKSLYLSKNNLTGNIPSSLGNLSSSFTVLDLYDNNLEGYLPDELGSLKLSSLALGSNRLRDKIPSSLFNISTLKLFSVTQNFLSGQLPTNLGLNLPNLQVLELGLNQFYGEIPVSVTNCSYLETLDLSNNKFIGIVPPSVGQLLNLQTFNLELNSLHGHVMDILVPLTNCTNLMVLSLSFNNFSGELSNDIGNLSSQINILYLGDNKISGTIPMELGNLFRLESLGLRDNSLTGNIPKNLDKLENVKMLLLQKNALSGQIPPTLCSNMTNLYELQLNDNNFEGDFGHSLAKCRSLQWLFASRNNFSGNIPSQMFGSYISPTRLELASNSLSGILPIEVGRLSNLQKFDVSNNKLFGHIPLTIGDCLVITFIDMHDNQFSGPLPPSLASLKGIEYLDLSDNALNGTIPSGLNRLGYLNHLNLSYNNLEGEVPKNGVFSNASQIMLQGNTKLCGGIVELGLPACPVVERKIKGKEHKILILILLIFGLVISMMFFLYLFLCKKSNRFQKEMALVPSEEMLRVSYQELYRACNKFSPTNLIGSGSFGFVYKGSLVAENGEIKVVAVKVLNLKKRGASRSFKAECEALSNLRHRNLVPLLTYCSSIDHKGDDFKALVYKFMEKGNLDTWLHLEPKTCLSLGQRINIASDVASALDYLHNHSHVAVAHCDVKPSNILLDDELTAYLGDFGLARLLPQPQQGASSSTAAIKGTIGYAAPEYAMGLDVSTRGDVYSYGILLLEMITGRRPTDDAFTEGLDLHRYVKAGFCDQVWKIFDPSLLSGKAQTETRLKAQECIISALELGIGCSQGAAKDRMDMKQVTRQLHSITSALCAA